MRFLDVFRGSDEEDRFRVEFGEGFNGVSWADVTVIEDIDSWFEGSREVESDGGREGREEERSGESEFFGDRGGSFFKRGD